MQFQTENFTFEIQFFKPFMNMRHKEDYWTFLMIGWTPWKQNSKNNFVYINKIS